MNFKDYKKAKKQDKPQNDPMDNLDAGAKMLLSNFVKDYEGKSYQEISASTGVSAATISRVSRCLNYGSGGYTKALEKMEDKA